MICLRIQVFGKVQGVFYRATSKTKADELGLTGWVKNESDGTVSLFVKGESKKVEEMVEWCKEGPTFSKVDKVQYEEVEQEEFSDFEIRY